MPIRGEDGLYGALEKELKRATRPLDCNAFFDKASIKAHAATAHRVSDYLGHMWRKGLVLRVPAPADPRSRSKWLYVWKGNQPKPVQLTMSEALEKAEVVEDGRVLLARKDLKVIEKGDSLVLILPTLSITIRQT